MSHTYNRIFTPNSTDRPHATASNAPPDPDAKLLAILQSWDQLKGEEMKLDTELGILENSAQAGEPKLPPALLLPIRRGGQVFHSPSSLGWHECDLRRISPDNVGELLSLRRDYELTRDAVWAGAREAQLRFAAIVDRNTEWLRLIGGTPALTPRGLVAKSNICRAEGLFRGGGDFNEFAEGLARDVERLAPSIIQGDVL